MTKAINIKPGERYYFPRCSNHYLDGIVQYVSHNYYTGNLSVSIGYYWYNKRKLILEIKEYDTKPDVDFAPRISFIRRVRFYTE